MIVVTAYAVMVDARMESTHMSVIAIEQAMRESIVKKVMVNDDKLMILW